MNRTDVLNDLRRVVGPRAVIDDAAPLLTYEAEGWVLDTHPPNVVVLPATTEETAAVVQIANRAGMPIVPRGAGTGLSGGATPIHGGIVISTARMERVLEVVHLQETFSDVVKTDKTGLSKTAHTRWMISAFANFLPGSTIFRLA